MIPMSGKIMGICCVALLPASRFNGSCLVVWLSVRLPSDIANDSNNFEIDSAHVVPMLALCEDDLCLLLFPSFLWPIPIPDASEYTQLNIFSLPFDCHSLPTHPSLRQGFVLNVCNAKWIKVRTAAPEKCSGWRRI